MSEQKRYTAQELRHTAMDIEAHVVMGPIDVFDSTLCSAVDMLCQAADAEEENAKLNARLDAVAKDNATMTDRMLEVINLCNKMKDDFSSWNKVAADFAQKVLRAASGESENENK